MHRTDLRLWLNNVFYHDNGGGMAGQSTKPF